VCLPLSREHQAVVLWGGWLLTGVVYFSISAFFHAYYLATLAPALAALTGIGIVQLWQLAENRRRMAVLVLGLVTLGTVIFQLAIIQQSGVPLTLWMIGVGLFILAGAGAAVRWLRGGSVSWKMATWGALVMALLLIPSAWGAATAMDPQQNPTLPAAFTGPASTSDGAAAAVPGGMMPAPGNAAVIPVEMMDRLVSYLQSHATGETYLIAVPNSMIGAKLALETGLPVMYMNGFNGSDSIQTADSIAELVADGQLRFIAPVSHSDSDQTGITAWVETNCSLVEDSQIRVAAPGMGGSGMPQPPNGKNGTLPASMPGMVGGISTALYDCAPAAAPEG
jgi:4-amino-4-deoxy-L-arabinose transferase-like glycosyltransferase